VDYLPLTRRKRKKIWRAMMRPNQTEKGNLVERGAGLSGAKVVGRRWGLFEGPC
jgi:hypothetical protein